MVDRFRLPAKPQLKKYSRGQLSAVGILVGLASRAPVTVLDEPYLGLDATARQHFADLLVREVSTHPRTVVLSTHLVDEMAGLLDRVLVLDRGRLVRDAATDDLHGRAHVVLGPAGAVERATTDTPVLASRRVGGFLERVVEADPDDAHLLGASAAGLEVRPASLQELVAALGADEEPAAPVPAPRTTVPEIVR